MTKNQGVLATTPLPFALPSSLLKTRIFSEPDVMGFVCLLHSIQLLKPPVWLLGARVGAHTRVELTRFQPSRRAIMTARVPL